MKKNNLQKLASLVRYYSIACTTAAGSGHPTSSLSATELMVSLMFGGFFRFDVKNPKNINNDRLIFSKGHASPLFYSLWLAAGCITESEILDLRKIDSPLEGHPTMEFPYTEAATGSLGQGLSIGLGMALGAKYLDKLPFKTFVLLGDSEVAEGSVWEAMNVAAHYKLDNLIAILDVNRLGQRGETMQGWDANTYKKRAEAFGWKAIVVDGHSHAQIEKAYKKALATKGAPTMIIAKTVKGKGVPFLENKEGWHGKALSAEQADEAYAELGPIELSLRGNIKKPLPKKLPKNGIKTVLDPDYKKDAMVATRKAYGNALVRLFPKFPNMVVLDAETSNSTFAETFKNKYPKNFFEMYIAEQNMAGTGIGLSHRGKKPFVSSFAAFLTRAADQIRMAQYNKANMVFAGSHAGVSIGEDGASQMALEDISLFRAVLGSVVLYPSDAMSAERLVEEAAKHTGISYIRTTRSDTPVLYGTSEKFPIGGCKVLKKRSTDAVTIVAAGITLHEALRAYDLLTAEGISLRIIDLYSIKPIDQKTLLECAIDTQAVITVEDHYQEGGLGEAVATALSGSGTPVHILAVRRMPRSGKPGELLAYAGISAEAIVRKVKEII